MWPHLRPIVIFALHTGLRYAELTTLTWAQIDLDRRTVTVESGTAKNRRARQVPLNSKAMGALPLHGERVESSAIDLGRILEAGGHRAGLTHVTPHSLRRTFATRCLAAGIDIVTVSQWLGHARVVQTQTYVFPYREHWPTAIERLVRPDLQQRTTGTQHNAAEMGG